MENENIVENNVGLSNQIEERLGYRFSNEALMMEALTHRSYQNEHPEVLVHNERLEFLGDAVLDLVVAQTLMERLPDAKEGQLTKRRSGLVNEQTLADLATRFDLGGVLLLGKGEQQNNGRFKSSILSNALEAVVGAIYLDSGYETVRQVVLSLYGELLGNPEKDCYQDAKTALQEQIQAQHMGMPCYNVIDSRGPDHNKIYEVEIAIDGVVIGRGTGSSKKEAEKNAAKSALDESLTTWVKKY